MCNKHVPKLIGKYRWARVMTNELAKKRDRRAPPK